MSIDDSFGPSLRFVSIQNIFRSASCNIVFYAHLAAILIDPPWETTQHCFLDFFTFPLAPNSSSIKVCSLARKKTSRSLFSELNRSFDKRNRLKCTLKPSQAVSSLQLQKVTVHISKLDNNAI